MKTNLLCYLFGHKTGELNDSGYPVCERCGCHSYYDDWNNCAKLLKPFTFFIRIYYKSKYNIIHWYDTKFNGNKLPF